MAKHSYEKAAWKRREARRRHQIGFPKPSWNYLMFWWTERPDKKTLLVHLSRDLDESVNHGVGQYTRKYRRQWRQAGRTICRLTALHDERAEELDPQPRRLGVMRDIW